MTRSSFRLCPCHLPLSFILSFSIALALQPLTMFHHKIQFWLLATRCLIVLLSPPSHPLLQSALVLCPPHPPPHTYLYYTLNTPSTILCLLLFVLHHSSVPTATVSHGDTRPIVPNSLACLKTFLLQGLADPSAVTVDAKSSEKVLLC